MKPRRYETLLLLNPDLSQEEQDQIKQKLNGIIEKMEGAPLNVEDWGRRRLPYLVKKQMHGWYLLLDFMGTPSLLAELERNIRIEERIYKHLTLVLDKNFSMEKYNLEKERLAAKKALRESETEGAAAFTGFEEAVEEGEDLAEEDEDETAGEPREGSYRRGPAPAPMKEPAAEETESPGEDDDDDGQPQE